MVYYFNLFSYVKPSSHSSSKTQLVKDDVWSPSICNPPSPPLPPFLPSPSSFFSSLLPLLSSWKCTLYGYLSIFFYLLCNFFFTVLHWSFKSIVFKCVRFLGCLLLVTSNIICGLREPFTLNHFFNLLRYILCPNIWSIL